MSAGVDVGNDRLARPVPIRVDHVAGVAVTQQLRVIPRVVGKRTLPRADAGCRDAPLGGTGLAHLSVQTAAWVPTTATVAYSSASLRSPCVHSEALTCTASSDASGRISTDDPYAEQAALSPGAGRVGEASNIIGPPRAAESSRYL